MSALYRPKRRWRRWVAFLITVFGLLLMVMALGIFALVVWTNGAA